MRAAAAAGRRLRCAVLPRLPLPHCASQLISSLLLLCGSSTAAQSRQGLAERTRAMAPDRATDPWEQVRTAAGLSHNS